MHATRSMNYHGRIVNEISGNKPEGRRWIERPRLRWFETLESICGRHSLKYCDRRQSAGMWASVIKVESSLRRPQDEWASEWNCLQTGNQFSISLDYKWQVFCIEPVASMKMKPVQSPLYNSSSVLLWLLLPTHKWTGLLLHQNTHTHSAGFLCRGDQPVAETCTWHHTSFTTDIRRTALDEGSDRRREL